jgi:hypothetical protein
MELVITGLLVMFLRVCWTLNCASNLSTDILMLSDIASTKQFLGMGDSLIGCDLLFSPRSNPGAIVKLPNEILAVKI